MKKLIIVFTLIVSLVMLMGCNNPSSLSFEATIPSQLIVNESFTVTATTEDEKAILASNLSISIKAGQSFVTVSGLTITGIAAGQVTITITYTLDGKTATKDYTFTVVEPEIVYGIPEPQTGFYMKDADVIEENNNRLIVFVTNKTSGEEDNVIKAMQGTYHENKGHAYGNAMTILQPSQSGWDRFIGGPTIVKGTFAYNSTNYQYLMAYQGTNLANENAFSIGFAVSNNPLEGWVKVGTEPVLNYDRAVYGESYAGYYAPSLVNLNKGSIVRLFFTWADAFGHFSYFVDINAANLNAMDISGFAMLPNHGNLSSGEDVTMIPNGSFAYDATNNIFYMVKDYSPTPSREPRVATRIELAKINEAELYTAKKLIGWQSIRLYDMFDTPETAYERLYSGVIVKDQYGHIINANKIEIIYNVSDLEADNPNYIFSQKFLTFTYE